MASFDDGCQPCYQGLRKGKREARGKTGSELSSPINTRSHLVSQTSSPIDTIH